MHLILALKFNFDIGQKLCPAELFNFNMLPSDERLAFLDNKWLD